MKILTMAVAAALVGSAASVHAQSQFPEAVNAPKFGIAVVDVSYIFKNTRSSMPRWKA